MPVADDIESRAADLQPAGRKRDALVQVEKLFDIRDARFMAVAFAQEAGGVGEHIVVSFVALADRPERRRGCARYSRSVTLFLLGGRFGGLFFRIAGDRIAGRECFVERLVEAVFYRRVGFRRTGFGLGHGLLRSRTWNGQHSATRLAWRSWPDGIEDVGSPAQGSGKAL